MNLWLLQQELRALRVDPVDDLRAALYIDYLKQVNWYFWKDLGDRHTVHSNHGFTADYFPNGKEDAEKDYGL
jgi:hypothetical protein